MSHSIAIILDGVNNATDALSSIVTIVGAKARRAPARPTPPLRLRPRENTSRASSSLSSSWWLASSLRESIDKIITRHPSLGHHHHRHRGGHHPQDRHRHHVQALRRQTNSEALIASGIDSTMTQCCRPARWWWRRPQNFWNLNIDGAVGPIISLVVLKAGFEVLGDASPPLIGAPRTKSSSTTSLPTPTVSPRARHLRRGAGQPAPTRFWPGAHRSARRYVRPRYPTPSPARSAKARREVRHPRHRGHLRRQHDRCVRPSACRPRCPREKATRRSLQMHGFVDEKPRPSTSIWS